MSHRLKCRWCEWTCPSVYTDGKGRIRVGAPRLRDHVEAAHPDELDAVEAELAREMREARP